MPDKVRVDRDDHGRLIYRYSRYDEHNPNFKQQGEIILPMEQVLHIPGLGFDGLVGYSPIAMAKNALGLAVASFIGWINDIKDYALEQAISGKCYPGFKVVEGRSNRRYTDTDAVAAAVTEAGYDPFEKKLMGVTAMTKLLGAKKFNTLLGSLIEKPKGKPTLVPESDKRPAWTIDDFKEETENE